MGGIEFFQSQDVQRVTFKPPPPPVQQPDMVQAQDIAPISAPAEDIKQIETGKGTPSEIKVVSGGGVSGVKPVPSAGLGDFLGDLLTIDKPSEPVKLDPPKVETPKPKDPPKVDPPKVETPKPKDPPKVEPPKVETPKPIPASGRTFKTQGDPIVKTGDGLQYSMNTPGTYTSLQSKSGDFKMEQTVSETPGKRHYNTAMGFQFGDTKIKFDTNGGKNAATMTINGEKVDLKYTAFSRDLPGGGKLSYDPNKNTVSITTPEGDKITVNRAWNDQKTNYLNATVELSEKRPAESVFGALGTLDADNDAKNDARMRDGSVYKGSIGDMWKTPDAFIKEWKTSPTI